MVSHWCLNNSKYPQVSGTLQSITANLNNAVIWMVSTPPLISKSSNPFVNFSLSVQSIPIIIRIPITFMFQSSFQFFSKVQLLIFLFTFLFFTLWSARTANSTIWQILFFLSTIARSGHLSEIRWSICILKSQTNLSVLFSRMDSGLCKHHLFVWSNLNFLHNYKWITFPTQPYLFLYSFSASLLHYLLCDWLFYLYHHITYICNFVMFCLFLHWYSWSLWHCSVLLSGDIQFLS